MQAKFETHAMEFKELSDEEAVWVGGDQTLLNSLDAKQVRLCGMEE